MHRNGRALTRPWNVARASRGFASAKGAGRRMRRSRSAVGFSSESVASLTTRRALLQAQFEIFWRGAVQAEIHSENAGGWPVGLRSILAMCPVKSVEPCFMFSGEAHPNAPSRSTSLSRKPPSGATLLLCADIRLFDT